MFLQGIKLVYILERGDLMIDFNLIEPKEMRKIIRNGDFIKPTSGLCRGYAQGNLVILPKENAFDFLLFSQRNPKPCPILDVNEVGMKEVKRIAKGSNIATDIPLYRIYKEGALVDEVEDIKKYWQDDFVSFVLGCSFTFESAMIDEGIAIRHIDTGKNVSMYITNIKCEPAGIFSGPMVVSMRPIPFDQVMKTIEITSRYPKVHGAPIHIGNPEQIGIKNILKPDFGDAVEIKENEVPVFWACGVTPQAVAMKVKPKIMITHAPGHMLITDIKNNELASL